MALATLDEATYHAELLESTERIAEILTSAEPALRVTTCPRLDSQRLWRCPWGRAHRWAHRITATRAQEPVDMSAVGLGLPATTTRYGAWLYSEVCLALRCPPRSSAHAGGRRAAAPLQGSTPNPGCARG